MSGAMVRYCGGRYGWITSIWGLWGTSFPFLPVLCACFFRCWFLGVSKILLSGIYQLIRMQADTTQIIAAATAWLIMKAIEWASRILGTIWEWILDLYPFPKRTKDIIKGILRGTLGQICEWAGEAALYMESTIADALKNLVKSMFSFLAPIIDTTKICVDTVRSEFGHLLWNIYEAYMWGLIRAYGKEKIVEEILSGEWGLGLKFGSKLGGLALTVMPPQERIPIIMRAANLWLNLTFVPYRETLNHYHVGRELLSMLGIGFIGLEDSRRASYGGERGDVVGELKMSISEEDINAYVAAAPDSEFILVPGEILYSGFAIKVWEDSVWAEKKDPVKKFGDFLIDLSILLGLQMVYTGSKEPEIRFSMHYPRDILYLVLQLLGVNSVGELVNDREKLEMLSESIVYILSRFVDVDDYEEEAIKRAVFNPQGLGDEDRLVVESIVERFIERLASIADIDVSNVVLLRDFILTALLNPERISSSYSEHVSSDMLRFMGVACILYILATIDHMFDMMSSTKPFDTYLSYYDTFERKVRGSMCCDSVVDLWWSLRAFLTISPLYPVTVHIRDENNNIIYSSEFLKEYFFASKAMFSPSELVDSISFLVATCQNKITREFFVQLGSEGGSMRRMISFMRHYVYAERYLAVLRNQKISIPGIGEIHIDQIVIPMLLMGSDEAFYGRQDPSKFGIRIETKYGKGENALGWFSDIYLCDIIPTIPYPTDENGNLVDRYIAKFRIVRENGEIKAMLINVYPSVTTGPERSRVMRYSSTRDWRSVIESLYMYGLIDVEGEMEGLSEREIVDLLTEELRAHMYVERGEDTDSGRWRIGTGKPASLLLAYDFIAQIERLLAQSGIDISGLSNDQRRGLIYSIAEKIRGVLKEKLSRFQNILWKYSLLGEEAHYEDFLNDVALVSKDISIIPTPYALESIVLSNILTISADKILPRKVGDGREYLSLIRFLKSRGPITTATIANMVLSESIGLAKRLTRAIFDTYREALLNGELDPNSINEGTRRRLAERIIDMLHVDDVRILYEALLKHTPPHDPRGDPRLIEEIARLIPKSLAKSQMIQLLRTLFGIQIRMSRGILESPYNTYRTELQERMESVEKSLVNVLLKIQEGKLRGYETIGLLSLASIMLRRGWTQLRRFSQTFMRNMAKKFVATKWGTGTTLHSLPAIMILSMLTGISGWPVLETRMLLEALSIISTYGDITQLRAISDPQEALNNILSQLETIEANLPPKRRNIRAAISRIVSTLEREGHRMVAQRIVEPLTGLWMETVDMMHEIASGAGNHLEVLENYLDGARSYIAGIIGDEGETVWAKEPSVEEIKDDGGRTIGYRLEAGGLSIENIGQKLYVKGNVAYLFEMKKDRKTFTLLLGNIMGIAKLEAFVLRDIEIL